MEEALDLRIHNRRRSIEAGFPSCYSSHVQFLFNHYKGGSIHQHHHPEETRSSQHLDDGDLVIVEADTEEVVVKPAESCHRSSSLPLLSPSPGTRSSDTETEKGSPFPSIYTSSTSPLPPSRPLSTQSSLQQQQMMVMDVDLSNSSCSEDAQKRRTPPSGGGRSTTYTSSKIGTTGDRMLKPSRLMCFLCDQKAKNGKTLETHIQKSHTMQTAQGRFYCCTECKYKSEDVDGLKSHFEESHSLTKTGGETNKLKAYFPCSHCSRMYRKQSLLDAHMRLVNQKDMWKKKNVTLKTSSS